MLAEVNDIGAVEGDYPAELLQPLHIRSKFVVLQIQGHKLVQNLGVAGRTILMTQNKKSGPLFDVPA